jgi:uncharacterized membrane protein
VRYRNLSVKIILSALIASIYAVVTIALASFGYSYIQIRISEGLTPLPFLMGFPAVAGLTIGCMIANFLSPIGLADLVFGSLLTFFAAVLSWKANFGRKLVACAYPIFINAFGVSIYVSYFYGVPYFFSVLTIGIGESIAVLVVGYPLLKIIEKMSKKPPRIEASAD